jgi:hypothetical protein
VLRCLLSLFLLKSASGPQKSHTNLCYVYSFMYRDTRLLSLFPFFSPIRLHHESVSTHTHTHTHTHKFYKQPPTHPLPPPFLPQIQQVLQILRRRHICPSTPSSPRPPSSLPIAFLLHLCQIRALKHSGRQRNGLWVR